MTELPFFRTTRPALVALCLVALQLVTALHFALVPHGFSAGLSGFVHVHAEASHAASRLELGRRTSAAPELVNGGASCTSESCPIGFGGTHSVLLSGSQASALLAHGVASARALPSQYAAPRSRVLLSAPKTSPPV